VVDRSAELEERVAYLAAALDSSDDAVLSLDLAGRITSGNRGAQRLLATAGSALLGVPFEDLVVEQDQPVWRRKLSLAVAGNPHERIELVLRPRTGAPVPSQVAVALVRAPDGAMLGVSLVVRDVGEQLLAQATLADSAQRVAQSEALAHVGSWAWDAGSDVVQWSEELHRIHGVSPLEFPGTMAAQLEHVHPRDRGPLAGALTEALQRGTPFEREFRVVRPDRSVRWVLARANVVTSPGAPPQGLLGIYHDITERHESALVLQEANERLTRLALYDRLTGLPNRALLVDRLAYRLARRRGPGARLDLLYLGVDDFKTLNDSAGYSVGDQVLTALAPVLGHAVRRVGLAAGAEEPVLARLGGDEFAILVDDSDARALAGSIHDVLRQRCRVGPRGGDS
jgi:diguanylate cyclase (GGDEF)-like protein/PAS domain S-box-containing protein